MPIFSRTVQRLNLAIEDKRAGVMDISRIILEDPSLTAKLLKLSNSPYYNPSRQSLATVTRATVLIGLNTIRDLAIACSFIETILTQRNKRQVNQEIARALHAAVQAKSLASLTNVAQGEEVFIAALLHNIGHVAFWCFEQKEGEAVMQLMEARNIDPETAERQVLNFKLKQLGAALSKSWKLGGLIEESFNATSSPSHRAEIVQVSCLLAKCAENGWNAEDTQKALNKIAQLAGKPVNEITAIVKANAESAIKLAAQFGATDAAVFIPGADKSLLSEAVRPQEEREKGDLGVLQVMQELSNLMSGEIQLNSLFEMVLEGIYRSLPMDRVLFALLTPDRKLLREKSSLGWPALETRGTIQIQLTSLPQNLFAFALDRGELLWAKPDGTSAHAGLFTPTVKATIGWHECFIAPLSLGKKTIGLFYADHALTHAPLTQELFDNFRQITQQANIALKLSQTGH